MLTTQQIERVVTMALEEDAPRGDVTSQTLVPASALATAAMVAREPGVLSGGDVFATAFTVLDPASEVTLHIEDGTAFAAGVTLATVEGPARSVLQSERVALNLVQRMSGIATLTAAYVREIEGTRARLVDTRKTTPGLRALERHAVLCGGGHNHRFSLSDAVMAKDNHLAVIADTLVATLLRARRDLPHTVHIEVEVDRLDQLDAVLESGVVDTIMLDNFTPVDLVAGITKIDGRALVEASGSVDLTTIRDIAEAGVDLISVGALTHSVRALDLGLDIAVT